MLLAGLGALLLFNFFALRYVGEPGYAGFVHGRLDDVLQKRAACRAEPVSKHMNKEHVSVEEDFSDVGPIGVVTRSAFFAHLAERFLEQRAP